MTKKYLSTKMTQKIDFREEKIKNRNRLKSYFMYRNRYRLDKRDEPNNNPFKWSGGSAEKPKTNQQSEIQLKPVLPVKKSLRKQNEKVVYCTYYNRDGYCRNGKI